MQWGVLIAGMVPLESALWVFLFQLTWLSHFKKSDTTRILHKRNEILHYMCGPV